MTSNLARRCLVCNGSRLHYLFSISGHRVVRCDDCHLLLADPQPSDAELLKLREAQSQARTGEAKDSEEHCYFEVLSRYHGAESGRLLLVGSVNTEIIALANTAGYEVTAIDDSTAACEAARGRLSPSNSTRIVCGDIFSLEEATGYDVALVPHELARVRDPRRLLAGIHRMLRGDGVIFLVTAEFDPKPRGSGRMTFRPDYLFHFRSSVLQSLLIDCGFGKIIVHKMEAGGAVIHMARKEPLRERRVLSVVVPVFNEEQTFSTAFDKLLAKEVHGLDIEILVIESNSTDGTRAEVLKYRDHPRVKIILEDTARGKGHAVRAGLKHITGDFVLIQDADLEYDLEDYEALLEPLQRGRAAFVLGARHGGSAWKMRQFNDQPLIASLLNFAHWFFTALINVAFGARLKDPFTMYKVFRRDCLYGLRLECNRFDFDWEMVISFLRKGYQPLEIPVNYRSRSFSEGKKVSLFRDPLTWLRILVKLRLRDLDPLKEIERCRLEGRSRSDAS